MKSKELERIEKKSELLQKILKMKEDATKTAESKLKQVQEELDAANKLKIELKTKELDEVNRQHRAAAEMKEMKEAKKRADEEAKMIKMSQSFIQHTLNHYSPLPLMFSHYVCCCFVFHVICVQKRWS